MRGDVTTNGLDLRNFKYSKSCAVLIDASRMADTRR